MRKRWLALVGVTVALSCAGLAVVLADSSSTDIGAHLPIQVGSIHLSGQASPGALVTFSSDGNVIGTQAADGSSNFDATFPGQLPGSHNYSVFYSDGSGRQSDSTAADANIVPATTTDLGPYFLAPTLQIGTSPIKRPQTEVLTGSTIANATVIGFWSGNRYGDSFSIQTGSDPGGNWSLSPGQSLHLGTYSVSAVSDDGLGNLSQQTSLRSIQVVLSADLNNDNRVNLTDFSILMFYYNGANLNKPADINDDGKTNLTDLSIMLFYWTG